MEWQIEVAGKPVTFIAQVGANGKVFLRADGRVVAQPLGETEAERVFAHIGAQFRLYRSGDGLALELIHQEPVEDQPVVATATQTRKRASRSMLERIAASYDAPPSVVARARIILAIAVLIMAGATVSALRFEAQRELVRQLQHSPIVGETSLDERGLERLDFAATTMASVRWWTAVFAFIGIMASGFLMRGFPWAPRVVEAIAWAGLLVHAYAVVRIDRLNHVQLHAAFNPVEAGTKLAVVHAGTVASVVVTALIAGAVIHLGGRRTVERLYAAESY